MAQRDVAKQEVQVQLSPAHYAYHASGGKWYAPAHLKLLAEYLVKVERGEIKRLIVAMPPRHGKSLLISQYFPAWFLNLNPDKRVVLTAYEAQFAATWGRKAKDEYIKYASLFGNGIKEDAQAIASWETTRGGGMVSVGAGGALTGKGADLLIIDDPIKNADEARSAHARQSLWDWYTSTAYSRLEPNGAVIILHTRWNEDDLIGRLLALEAETEDHEKENWVVLNLPALAEDDDQLGRKPGQALWPERYDESHLARMKRTSGSYVWSSLYQQHPAPLEGQIFKNDTFKYFSITENGLYKVDDNYIDPGECKRFQTVDLAASIKNNADYFVITTWATTPKNNLLLLDVLRTKVEGPDQIGILQAQYHKHLPAYIGIESVSFQITAVQNAIRAGLPVRKLIPDKDKVSRAITAAVKYESGTIYHLSNANWLADYESELLNFPNGKHDDQVDCVAYAALQNIARGLVFGSVSTKRH